MPLSPAEQRELDQLELQELEAQEAASQRPTGGGRSPAVRPQAPIEEGLRESKFTPGNIGRQAMELLGIDTNTGGEHAANQLTMGHLPQAVGAAKALAGGDYVTERDRANSKMQADAARSPGSAVLGNVAGGAAAGGAMSAGAGAAGEALANGGKVAQTAAKLINPAKSVVGRIAQSGGQAGVQGALYNPGDEKGVVNPIQAGDRLSNFLLGTAIGVGTGTASEGIKAGAQLAKDTRIVKKAGQAANYVRDLFGGADEQLQANVLNKNKSIVDSAVKGKSANVNLDDFHELAPDLVDDMRARATPRFRQEPVPGTSSRTFTPEPSYEAVPDKVIPAEAGGTFQREPVYQTTRTPNPNAIAGGPEFLEERSMVPGSDKVHVAPAPEQRIPQEPIMKLGQPVQQDVAPIMQQVADGHEVPGEDLLKLRRFLDKESGWRVRGEASPEHIAASQKFGDAANSLREPLASMDPSIAPANKAMEEGFARQKVLTKASQSKDPLSKLLLESNAPTWDLIDESAGTNLAQRAKQLGTAKKTLLKPENFFKPLEWPNELKKIVVRGGSELSRALNAAPKGTKETLLNEALEAKRKADK